MVDSHGGSSSATITVTVTNIPPVANNDTVSTPANVPITITPLTNDVDANGDPLIITIATAIKRHGLNSSIITRIFCSPPLPISAARTTIN